MKVELREQEAEKPEDSFQLLLQAFRQAGDNWVFGTFGETNGSQNLVRAVVAEYFGSEDGFQHLRIKLDFRMELPEFVEGPDDFETQCAIAFKDVFEERPCGCIAAYTRQYERDFPPDFGRG